MPDPDSDDTELLLEENGNRHDDSHSLSTWDWVKLKILRLPEKFKENDIATGNSQRISPEANASYINQLMFWWFNDLMSLGYQKPLMDEDLYQLQPEHDATHVTGVLEANWNSELEKSERDISHAPSLRNALFKTYGWEYAQGAFPRLIKVLGSFVGPFLLKRIVSFVEDQSQSLWYGTALLFILFLATLLTSVALNRYWHLTVLTAMHVRTSVVGLVYRKSLKLSAKAKQSSSTGEIVNLMANDATRLQDTVFYLHFLWATPLLVIVCFILVSLVLGVVPTLAGYSVFVVMTPASFYITRLLDKTRQAGIKVTDKRVKTVTEIFQAIKTIKLYAWEAMFGHAAEETRTAELRVIRKYQLVKAFNTCSNNILVPLVSTVAFVTFTLRGEQLSASTAFSSIALFGLLRWPFTLFNQVLTGLVEAKVSIARLESFLIHEEVPTNYDEDADEVSVALNGSNGLSKSIGNHKTPHISIKGGSFRWDREHGEPVLHDINLEADHAQLICIVGPVGSGKSSLLNVILKEIEKMSGTVSIAGTVSYASQNPFLMNATVRDNILFGKEYDSERYERSINVACMTQDLEMLIAGDLTRIGERGVSLSGGQKARISLARSVYANGDIFLLDDPLSAVDVHVGNRLFTECISKELKGKIVILVTHQLQYLAHADKVLVMEDGRVTHSGSYHSIKEQGLDMGEMLRKFGIQEHIIPDPASDSAELVDGVISVPTSPSIVAKHANATIKANVQQDEERELGSVAGSVYKSYFFSQKAWWGLACLVVVLYRTSELFQSYWLAYWSNTMTAGEGDQELALWFMTIYALGTTLAGLFLLGQESLIAVSGIKSGSHLYNRMFHTLFRATMEFFDQTPKGRIMARISSDTDQLDNVIAGMISILVNTSLQMVGTFIVVVTSALWFIFIVPLLVFLYIRIYLVFIAAYREMARLKSISQAPVFSLFSETMNGLYTVRAYKMQEQFTRDIEAKLNANQRSYIFGFTTGRWLSVRMDFISGLIVMTIAAIAIFGRSTVSAGLVGIALSYSLLSSELIGGFIRSLSEVENKMSSVERMEQYSRVGVEPPAIIERTAPAGDWPQKGEITFSGVKMRYRHGLPLVLKGLTFSVRPREKIGIVGRTGAGKSSILSVLFRLVPLEDGQIIIDSVDVGKIGLHHLRSKLSIIPQDPVIFDGTVRRNLDPSLTTSDADLWSALERVHLKSAVQALPGGVDATLAEDGANFSVGQKQLLCIARALIRRSKILLLDEASSSIDLETDYLLQETIRKEFKDCTILTIAHRLQTIMDSDRILVMRDGEVAEFDSPENLLADPNSLFCQMKSAHS